ncbi:hypothetical protein PV721_02580 [Streptomyces sp. MB09-01]|uniref:hypothetical protein n=1 Tax=Streptomyces sp. MB09-01 TaxID=3028666 RepID=UPI0029A7052B|nr:hypothetical protein [Streptomyces sp. MB09-01]MDX3533271.1 hypothetical protein [Streptomyces sp. MB09-01]
MNYTRFRRPAALLLLTVGIVCAAAVVAGIEAGDEGGLVLLTELQAHMVPLGWLAVAALTGATLLGLARSPLRLPLVTALLVLGVPMMLLASFVSATFGSSNTQEKTEPAPGRDDRWLVVERDSILLDPVWHVYVVQGNRPLERRWSVGSFGGRSDAHALRETVWTSPDRIRMTTEEGAVHEVTVAAGGRPDRTVDAGW